jgi:hypothetical protein
VMLCLVLGFGSVVVVHGMWKLSHLSLVIFGYTCCGSAMVQLLAVDIIKYLHLPSLRSQAHLPVPVQRSLRSWVGRKVLRGRLHRVMLVNASV